MEIIHDKENNSFKVTVDGYTAHVDYVIKDNALDIRHTLVPKEIGGKGIAAALVKAAYDYAKEAGLKPMATCSYAVVWLERHPEYQGVVGEDYGGKGTCAL
ncbi:MAG: GNAT family N-acetyltransferase [Bacteroidales bacterium]